MDNNTNEEQVLLKTSIVGGFAKNDVLSYIDKLRCENDKNVLNLKGSLVDMEKASDDLKNQIGTFEGKISQMESQLSQKSDKIGELLGKLDSLKIQVSDSTAAKEEIQQELSREREYSRTLAQKTQSLENKAKRYDEMSQKVGEVLLSAKEDADNIIRKADMEAKSITQSATLASYRIAGEMQELKGEINNMRENMERLTESFSVRLNEADKIIDELLSAGVFSEKTNTKCNKEVRIYEKEPDIDNKDGNGENFFRRAAKIAR
ncbi:MAG: DivIVA domain-containing protein [Oscillospiraceae bacterium]